MTKTLTIPDAAVALGVCEDRVYRLIRKGKLPARKYSGVLRVRAEDVIARKESEKEKGGWPAGKPRKKGE